MCEKLAVDTKKTRQKKFDKKIKFTILMYYNTI